MLVIFSTDLMKYLWDNIFLHTKELAVHPFVLFEIWNFNLELESLWGRIRLIYPGMTCGVSITIYWNLFHLAETFYWSCNSCLVSELYRTRQMVEQRIFEGRFLLTKDIKLLQLWSMHVFWKETSSMGATWRGSICIDAVHIYFMCLRHPDQAPLLRSCLTV